MPPVNFSKDSTPSPDFIERLDRVRTGFMAIVRRHPYLSGTGAAGLLLTASGFTTGWGPHLGNTPKTLAHDSAWSLHATSGLSIQTFHGQVWASASLSGAPKTKVSCTPTVNPATHTSSLSCTTTVENETALMRVKSVTLKDAEGRDIAAAGGQRHRNLVKFTGADTSRGACPEKGAVLEAEAVVEVPSEFAGNFMSKTMKLDATAISDGECGANHHGFRLTPESTGWDF